MTGHRPVRWEELLPDDWLAAFAEGPVCWMAYGLAEPHGAYNALGLDWLKAQGLCEAAARQHGGIVAPPFCWHIAERPAFGWLESHGVRQSLCSSLPGDLFLHIVLHQLRVFDARGFEAAILVTGHYGGIERDMRLVCDYYRLRSGTPMQIRCLSDNECIHHENYRGDHAGPCETQQLMALHPDRVDLSRTEPSPTSGPWCGTDFAGRGIRLDAGTGRKIVDSQIEGLGHIQRELRAAFRPVPNRTVPSQDTVEEYWQTFARLTRKYWMASLTWEEYGQTPPPFPGWAALK